MFDINFIEKRNLPLNVGDYIWVSSGAFEDNYEYDDFLLPVLYIDNNGLINASGENVTFNYSGSDLDCIKLSMNDEMLNFFKSGGLYREVNGADSLELFERHCKPGDLLLMSYSEYEMDCVEYAIYVGHNEVYNGCVVLKYSLGYYLKLDNLSSEELMIRENLYLNYQKYINISNLKSPSLVKKGDTYFLDDLGSCELHICLGRRDDKLVFINLHSDESFIMDFLPRLMRNELHTIDLLDYMSYVDYNKLFSKRKYGYSKSKFQYLGRYNIIEDSLSCYDMFSFSKSINKFREKIYDKNRDEKNYEKSILLNERKEKLRSLKNQAQNEMFKLQEGLSNNEKDNVLIREKIADLIKAKTESEYQLYDYYGDLEDKCDEKYKNDLDIRLSNFESYLDELSISIKSGIVYSLNDLENLARQEYLRLI